MICLHIWNETIPYQTQLSYTHCSNFKPKRYLTHTCLYLSTSKSNKLCLQLRKGWLELTIPSLECSTQTLSSCLKNHSSLERQSEKTIKLFWWVNSTTSITIKPLKYCLKNTMKHHYINLLGNFVYI